MKNVKDAQSMEAIVERVDALEKEVAGIKEELKEVPRIRTAKDTGAMLDDLMHEAVKDMHDGCKQIAPTE